ncbi:hypothetical protein ACFYZJ_32655 [Streptomyces sp. NPDC001848]|uniref:hypothetical protein n=1 Tax=Streptomyces sp. NPDC001848 TaxID=3364618 RepID=UPI003694E815
MTIQSENGLRSVRSSRGIPNLDPAPPIPDTTPVAYFGELSKQFPEGIFSVDLAGQENVFVYDPDLVSEVCDETRFGKPIFAPLSNANWPTEAVTPGSQAVRGAAATGRTRGARCP